jgi:hypothetical protein
MNTTTQKRVLFIHHSTGGLLLRFGQIRKQLMARAPHIELWDHAYNLYPSLIASRLLGPITYRTGLSDSRGHMIGKDFDITISNNSPKEYAEIFARPASDSTLKQILAFDLVIFKNCFPTSQITSDGQLSDYKLYYTMIFKSLSKYSNKFIVFTPPPLRKEMTTASASTRAQGLSAWLKQQENRLAVNVSVFDFFDLLSDKEGENANRLKREYCSIIPFDSHPNIRANQTIGPLFVNAIVKRL